MIAGFLPILRAEALHQLVEVSSPFREGGKQLISQTFPIRNHALGVAHPREGRPFWWRRVSLHPFGDSVRIKFRPQGEMGHDVAHFPVCTGAGVAPRIGGEGVEVLRELLCCCLAQMNTVLSCVHGLLLCVFVFAKSQKSWRLLPMRNPNFEVDSISLILSLSPLEGFYA